MPPADSDLERGGSGQHDLVLGWRLWCPFNDDRQGAPLPNDRPRGATAIPHFRRRPRR